MTAAGESKRVMSERQRQLMSYTSSGSRWFAVDCDAHAPAFAAAFATHLGRRACVSLSLFLPMLGGVDA